MSGRPTGREFEALVHDVVWAVNDRDLAFFDDLLDAGSRRASRIFMDLDSALVAARGAGAKGE